MQQGAHADDFQVVVAQVHSFGDSAGIFADAPAVPGGVSIASIQGLRQRSNELHIRASETLPALAHGLRGIVEAPRQIADLLRAPAAFRKFRQLSGSRTET